MLLKDLIKPAEVRMLMGLSDLELPDEHIRLEMFERQIRRTLREFGADTLTYVTGLTALDSSEFSDALQDLCTLAVAHEAATGLANLAPKTLSDGKAMRQRDTGTVDELKQEIEAKLKQAKDRFRSVMASVGLVPASGIGRTFRLMSVSSPSTDQVTG